MSQAEERLESGDPTALTDLRALGVTYVYVGTTGDFSGPGLNIEALLQMPELALRASQSAMLHTGAKGYLQSAPAQRKLRESYFVAIVTPAIKHLRKELDTMAAAA